MPRNFYFGTDAHIVTGSANFSTLISAAPTTYGLVAAQATAFAALNTSLQNAYSEAIEPSTRTPVSIEAKNIALRAMRAEAILLSKIIYATATVNDSQLIALGLLPRPTRQRVGPPVDAPVVDIVSVVGNTVKVRLHAAGDSSKRGKPDGVDGAAMYSFVGAVPPADEATWQFEGITSRTKNEIVFPASVAPGSQVWLTAFWFNERKEQGPAATKVTTNLQGGGVAAA